MKIRGVNLGNWLVLEKWMSPFLFEGTGAQDEYYLARSLPPEVYAARLAVHRHEYITERDFATIRRMGLNMVRIPVPYFLFGDRPPFLGCVEFLDKAFGWAEKFGLQVLIDLHTTPGSQNGFDNGGLCGVVKWAQDPGEVEFVLALLERLALRYGNRPGLWGIQPVNEPLTDAVWDTFNVQKRYPPVDAEMARGSAPLSLEFLRGFYREAYRRMRRHLSVEKAVVFHDGFQLKVWKEFLADPGFQNVVLDTHQYLMVAEMHGCDQSVEGYLAFIRDHFDRDFAEVARYTPVICGEWCLFNSLAVGTDTRGGQTVLNGMDFPQPPSSLSAEELQRIYRAVGRAQIEAWNRGAGHFYWNYKLLLDPAHDPQWRGWDCWDLGKSVDQGWIDL
jgi:hypothetical protein